MVLVALATGNTVLYCIYLVAALDYSMGAPVRYCD
jgi:hypothetical protein